MELVDTLTGIDTREKEDIKLANSWLKDVTNGECVIMRIPGGIGVVAGTAYSAELIPIVKGSPIMKLWVRKRIIVKHIEKI